MPSPQARPLPDLRIRVIPAIGANALSVAEYVVTTAMVLLRGAFLSTRLVAEGGWPRTVLSGGHEAAAAAVNGASNRATMKGRPNFMGITVLAGLGNASMFVKSLHDAVGAFVDALHRVEQRCVRFVTVAQDAFVGILI